MQEVMKKRAIELLTSGEVARVIGWKKGEFAYDATPAIFNTAEEIEKDQHNGGNDLPMLLPVSRPQKDQTDDGHKNHH